MATIWAIFYNNSTAQISLRFIIDNEKDFMGDPTLSNWLGWPGIAFMMKTH